MLVDLCLNKIPIRLLHLVYVWLFGWFYWVANYAAYEQDPRRDGALAFLKWSEDDGAFGLSAAHTVAFTNHIALGSIYVICFLLSLLKFAAADVCCSFTVLQIDVKIPIDSEGFNFERHTVTIPAQLVSTPAKLSKTFKFIKPKVNADDEDPLMIPGNEFVSCRSLI